MQELNRDSKIYIAGHKGMVGSAILRRLESDGYCNLIFKPSDELDLRNQYEVEKLFSIERPEYVFLSAAKVGGIYANNKYRADFIYDNLQIQNNIIHFSYKYGVKKLIFLGSSCIYPRNCDQPIKEDYLLSGKLEKTNEPYAVAKIAGIKMCESYNLQYGTNFLSLMPTNLYGPGDNYDLKKSHVLPAMIRKISLGKFIEENNWQKIREDLKVNPIDGLGEDSSDIIILKALENFGIVRNQKNNEVVINLWGSGRPLREFLHVDILADACLFVMSSPQFNSQNFNHPINVGSEEEISIRDLAKLIKKQVEFNGKIKFDKSMPDGTFRKLLDCSRIKSAGWDRYLALEDGIKSIL